MRASKARTSPQVRAARKGLDVVVVGSVAQDIIHTPHDSAGPVLGGSALHFSNAASFFASVGVVGVVGEDFPLHDLEFLRRRKVDLTGLAVRTGNSFLWEGRYFDHFVARETIRTELGVFADFDPILPDRYRNPKILFLAAIHPGLQLRVLEQVDEAKLVAIDTFKLWIDTARDDFLRVLKQCDLFFVNDDEVRWLTGEHNLLTGAETLHKLGPDWVVVKKGEHGSFLLGPRGIFLANTYPVRRVVDPTGAGDAFAGGLLGYLASQPRMVDQTLRRAMTWASVAGSFNVEGFGPDGLRNRTRTDLTRRFRDLCNMIEVK
jgi:sugar/nucleoside kinase (ribokinase family)